MHSYHKIALRSLVLSFSILILLKYPVYAEEESVSDEVYIENVATEEFADNNNRDSSEDNYHADSQAIVPDDGLSEDISEESIVNSQFEIPSTDDLDLTPESLPATETAGIKVEESSDLNQGISDDIEKDEEINCDSLFEQDDLIVVQDNSDITLVPCEMSEHPAAVADSISEEELYEDVCQEKEVKADENAEHINSTNADVLINDDLDSEYVTDEERRQYSHIYVVNGVQESMNEDATHSIQEALDKAGYESDSGNSLVKILPGSYSVGTLYIHGNTDLSASNAEFIGQSSANTLLENYQESVESSCANEINIIGGTWQYGDTNTKNASTLFSFHGVFGLKIKDIIFANSATAISLSDCNNANIIENQFKDIRDNSIYLENSVDVNISGNDFLRAGSPAICVANSQNTIIDENSFSNCGYSEMTNNPSIIVSNSNGTTINNNTFEENWAGAQLVNCSGGEIKNNDIKYSENHDINLTDTSYFVIEDNLMGGGTTVLGSSSSNTIKNNSVFRGEWKSDSHGYFYKNNDRSIPKKEWLNIDNNKYYVDASGYRTVGWLVFDDSKYYFSEDGKLNVGFTNIGTDKYYFYDSGKMAEGWTKLNGQYYFFEENKSGKMVTGWLNRNNKKYYLNLDGTMATGWKKIDGYYYFFKEGDSGRMLTGWLDRNNQKYYLNPNGTMATGWKKVDGNYYFFKEGDSGRMLKGWLERNNQKYYLNQNGIMVTGWKKIDGHYYFFKEGDSGRMLKGWLERNSQKYYLNQDGTMATGWKKIDGYYYFFKEGDSGRMLTGWLDRNSRKFYLNQNGKMATGWKKIDGKYYFFKEGDSGRMLTGWLERNGQKYYLNSNGVMATGWKKIGNNYYFFKEGDSGRMLTGWLDRNGQKYYLNSKGIMAQGWTKINNHYYYFKDGGSGRMKTGWFLYNGKVYHLGSDGIRAEGYSAIDGESFTFNSDGVLISNHTTKSFLAVIKDVVVNDMKNSGILASLTAAQALLESGCGNSQLTKIANNLFGMKGFYYGNSVTMQTQEYVGGRYITENDIFRKYGSWEESIADHSDLFNSLSRYANLRGLTDYRRAATYVRQDGYATDPQYTLKLINIIKKYDLNQWDGANSYASYGSSDRDVVITASALNIRSTNGTNGRILGSLTNGTVVVVDAVVGNWGRLADYTDGWICMDYVRYR